MSYMVNTFYDGGFFLLVRPAILRLCRLLASIFFPRADIPVTAYCSEIPPGDDSSVDKDRAVRGRVRGGVALGVGGTLETERTEEGVRLGCALQEPLDIVDVRRRSHIVVGDYDLELDAVVQLDNDCSSVLGEFEPGDDPVELAPKVIALRVVRHFRPEQRTEVTDDKAITPILESVLVR